MTSEPRVDRLLGIDVARGALLAFMLFTPAGGDPSTYTWLRHSPWDGVTLSDLILPSFLVTSGASLAFLLRPPLRDGVRLRLVRRFVALVVLGVLYNAWGGSFADFSIVRLTGVLQLIGVSGAIAAVAVLVTRRRWAYAVVALGVVFLHLIALLTASCAGTRCSPFHSLDVAVFGASHTYRMAEVPFDPEGVVPMVAASALVLAGVVVGDWLRVAPRAVRSVVPLAVAAGVLVGAALALDLVQPIDKRLHTPAFSAVAAGVAIALLAASTVAFDVGARGAALRRVLAFPLLALGRNALVVFLAERVLTVAAANTRMGDSTLQAELLASLPGAPVAAHLWYGLVILAVVLTITTAMHGLRWRIAL